MLENISYFLIFGKPLIWYLGMMTLLSLISTAAIGYLNFKGKMMVPFKWHPRIAALTLILALIHGSLGLMLYL